MTDETRDERRDETGREEAPDAAEPAAAGRPDEDLDEEDIAEEEGGGGKLGLIIIGLLVVGLLVVAYLNKRSYEGRTGARDTDTDNVAAPPRLPGLPAEEPPKQPRLSVEEWYRQALERHRRFALQQVFQIGERFYTLGKPTRVTPERRDIGWLFDTTRLAEGVEREHFFPRLLSFGPVYADSFTPLGLPDGVKGVYEPAGETKLDDETGGLCLAVGDGAKFYPFRFLNWHEVVNDTVGGMPVVVVWSSLAQALLALDRRLDGKTLTFGSAGPVYQGAIVIYDAETRSLWSPVTGRGLTNVYADRTLKPLQVYTARWKFWREKHPHAEALVGTDPEQKQIDYRRNLQLPSPDYRRLRAPAHPVEGYDVQKEAIPMRAVVIGVEAEGRRRAYPYGLAVETGHISDKLGETAVVLDYEKETGILSAADAEGNPLLYRTMYWITWKGNFPDSDFYTPPREATDAGPSAPAPDEGAPREGPAEKRPAGEP